MFRTRTLRINAASIVVTIALSGCAGSAALIGSKSQSLTQLPARSTDAASSTDKITLTTARGVDAIYKTGDSIVVMVQADDEGFLNCFYQSNTDQVFRLFPNRYQPMSQVVKNALVTIPNSDEFVIEFEEAGATENILCVFADTDINPFVLPALREPDLEPLDVETLSELYKKEVRSLPDIFDLYRNSSSGSVEGSLLTVKVHQ